MYKRHISCLSAIILLFTCNAVYAADGELKTEEEKTFYYMGSMIGGNLKQLNLTDDELDSVLRGMRDSATGMAIELDDQIYQPKLQAMGEQRMAAAAEEEKIASQDYLEKMAAEDGAITTESGIVFRELVAGTGKTPTVDSVVKAHYHGTLRDGTVFDSSIERGEPFTAPLSNVIPCWQEAITMMKEGGKSEVTCPAAVAYGDRAAGKIPAGAVLNFQVELIAVVE
jgi:FKBP-type peptidyl-prolyl cis-trans isomerase FkpA